MMGGPGPMIITGDGPDSSAKNQRAKPGTAKRVIPYTRAHRRSIGFLMILTTLNAGCAVAPPLLLKYLIDDGILAGDTPLVIWLSVTVAVVAAVAAVPLARRAVGRPAVVVGSEEPLRHVPVRRRT